jgi:hypothetical protein
LAEGSNSSPALIAPSVDKKLDLYNPRGKRITLWILNMIKTASLFAVSLYASHLVVYVTAVAIALIAIIMVAWPNSKEKLEKKIIRRMKQRKKDLQEIEMDSIAPGGKKKKKKKKGGR